MTIISEQIDIWRGLASETRDAVQARLRNVVRVVLRKHGYPQVLRDAVTERVVEITKLDSAKEAV